MQTISQLELHEADVGQIVEEVFQTMLDLPVQPSEKNWSPGMNLLTAVVHFAGSWNGAVLLECAPDQAFEFTGRLTGAGRPEAMNDDVRDALGELTNMVAGNLKSVLTPGVGLSMPSVVEGTDYSLRMCGNNMVTRLAFSDGANPFWVALIEVIDR